jgi:hypothetical protein
MRICLLASSPQIERITQPTSSAEDDEQDEGTKMVPLSTGSTSVISIKDTTDEVVDDNYVFRGFLALCLRGLIPIETGANMKSSLLTAGNENASYGRKTILRHTRH